MILVAALGFVSSPTRADQAHDRVTASIGQFGALYGGGHLKQAIATLPGIFKDLEGLAPFERIAVYGTLEDVCLEYYEFGCVQKIQQPWQSTLDAWVKSSPDPQQMTWAREDYSERLARMNVQANGKDWLRENLQQLIEFAPDPQSTMDFDRTNLTIAQAWLLLEDLPKAAFYLRRGWLHLISTQHINAHRYEALMPAYSLLFFQLGQFQRGDAAMDLMRPGLVRLATSNQYNALNLAQADLLQANFANRPASAIAAARRALKLLDEVEIEDNVRQVERMNVLSEAVIMCLLNPSKECQVDEWLPSLEKATAAIAPLLPEGGHVALRLSGVAMAMGQAGNQQQPSELVRKMCGLSLMPGDSLFAQADHSTQLACRYFMAVAGSEPDSGRFAIEAARNEIGRLRRIQQLEPFEIGPLNIYTRAVLLVGASAELQKPDRDAQDDELLLEIAALINRTQQSVETQYVQLLAGAGDRNEALNLQALHRIEQNLFRQEKLVLDRHMKQQAGGNGPLDQLDVPAWLHLANLAQMSLDRSEVKAKAGEAFKAQWTLLDRLHASLRPDERFVTAFPGPGGMIHLCASPSAFVVGSTPLDPPQTLLDLKILRAALTNPNPPSVEADGRFPFAESRRITRLLFGEGTACIGDADHLIVAPPPGELRTIPLAVLQDAADPRSRDPDRIDNTPWLGLTRALSTMVDAQELISIRQLPRESADMPYLGIGDPLLGGTTQDGQPRVEVALRGVKRRAGAADLSSLEALPETKDEIEFMKLQFGSGSRALLSADATEANLRRQPLADYRVVDFATHGLVREEIEGITEPALVLTPGDSRAPADDGVLTATKISELDLNADLVVLSACNTARFDLDVFGPEAGSLSTAFFMAGARSTVASLWSVDSHATAQLMESFGTELAHQAGAGPAFALRSALHNFLRAPPSPEYRHPRFWAAFSTYGDGGARRASNSPVSTGLHLVEHGSNPPLGELDSLLALPKGKALVIGFHDTSQPRVAGDLRLLDHGAVVWQASDPGFSFIPVQSQKPGLPPILAWNSTNKILSSELRWYSEAGLLQRRQVLPPWPNALLDDVLEQPDGLVASSIPIDAGAAVQLRHIDRSGKLLAEQAVPLAAAAVPTRVRLFKGGAGLWLAVTELDPARTGTVQAQAFGTRMPCNAFATELHLLGADLHDLVPPRILRDAEINDVGQAADGDLAALTVHDSCDGFTHVTAATALLQPQGEVGYRLIGKTGFPTDARRLVRMASGEWTLVGTVHRDLEPYEPPVQGDNDYSASAMLRRESAARQTGLFAAPVSPNGEIGTPGYVFLGGDFFVGDALEQDSGALLIAGANNYRQFSGELRRGP